jgi:hypothetical protein
MYEQVKTDRTVLELMKLLAQKMTLIDSYYSVCVYEAFTSPGKHYVSETLFYI